MDTLWDLTDKLENHVPKNTLVRAGMGAAGGWLVTAALRPGWAYDANGQPYVWAVMPDLYEGSKPATLTPWFLGPLGGAVLASLFI